MLTGNNAYWFSKTKFGYQTVVAWLKTFYQTVFIVKDKTNNLNKLLFTGEVLYRTLCEIESLLNNRPLTGICNDVNDNECFTPNHFLIGEQSVNFSPGTFTDEEINLRRSVQAAIQIFCKRWLKEYLPSLTIRKK